MDDHLGQHGVVVGGDLGALVDAGVDAGLVGPAEVEQPARLGEEAGVGVLGVEPDLDGVAGRRDVFLRQRQRLAHRHPQLQLDEIEAGDHLGDGVLHLEPGVHLDEAKGAPVVVDEELAGAGVAVADVAGEGDGRRGQLFPEGGVDGRRRRLLQDLLVAPLEGAVPLAEVDHTAEGVGHDLDLDVAGGGEVALEEELGVAEGAGRHPPGRGQGGEQVVGVADHRHPLAAAAGGRLDDQRVADLLGRPLQGGVVLVVPISVVTGVAGQHRDAGGFGDALGLVLPAHGRQHVGRWTDEGEARRLHRPSEVGVFGQETEAGVDEIGPQCLGRLEDLLDPQVRLGRRGGADAVGGVGHADERRAEVGLGVDGGAAEPHAPGGAEDPHGDLAPVGDEDGGNVVRVAVGSHRDLYIRKTP